MKYSVQHDSAFNSGQKPPNSHFTSHALAVTSWLTQGKHYPLKWNSRPSSSSHLPLLFFFLPVFLSFSGDKKTEDYLFGNSPWTPPPGAEAVNGGQRQKKRWMIVSGGGRHCTHAYWVTVSLPLINSSWGAAYLPWCAHLFTKTQWHLFKQQQKVGGSVIKPPISFSLGKFLFGLPRRLWRFAFL